MARTIPELLGLSDQETKALRAICDEELRSYADQLRILVRQEAARQGVWEEPSHEEAPSDGRASDRKAT